MQRLSLGVLVAVHITCAGATAQSDTLRIVGARFTGDLPTLVADERDFFQSAELDAEVEYAFDTGAGLTALRRGDTDVVLTDMTAFVIDRLQDSTPGEGDDPVILANLLHGLPDARIAVLRSLGVEKPGDLAGKRLGLTRGTFSDYLWSVFAAFHGIEGSVDLFDLRFDEIPQALVDGRVDATVIFEPWDELEETWQLPLTTFPSDFILPTHWLVVTTRDAIQQRPGDIAALLKAYAQACDWIERNPEDALTLFAERWGFNTQLYTAAAERLPIFDVTLDWSIYASYREQSAWAAREGHANRSENGSFVTAVSTLPLASFSPSSVLLPIATWPDIVAGVP